MLYLQPTVLLFNINDIHVGPYAVALFLEQIIPCLNMPLLNSFVTMILLSLLLLGCLTMVSARDFVTVHRYRSFHVQLRNVHLRSQHGKSLNVVSYTAQVYIFSLYDGGQIDLRTLSYTRDRDVNIYLGGSGVVPKWQTFPYVLNGQPLMH